MDFLRADDVAALLHVTRKHAYRVMARGQVPAIKMGNYWRVPQAAWDQWYAGQTAAALAAVRSATVQAAHA